jgi:hypothetical protein
MNIIICVPYFNNSHFIDIQIKSFKKYLKNCNWKLCIIDDSNENTLNVLLNKKENVKEVCSKYKDDIIYVKFNQNLHRSNNAIYKHCDILNFIIKNLSQNFKNYFDYVCLFDADMGFVENFDANEELSGYDIVGPKRIQWLSNIQISNSPIFEYLWVHNCFFNLKTITNIQDINFNTIKNTTTDTGSMIIEFLYNNPQYKIKYLNFSSGFEVIPKLYNFEFFWNRKIIHFGSGTLWAGEQNRFLNISYKDTFNEFCKIIENELTLEQKEIIEKTYSEKWYEFHKKFVGVKYTREDLLKYGIRCLI